MLPVIWWRDIPAQVAARRVVGSSKTGPPPRFQVAIDKAANRAGLRAYNDYIEEWRKTQRACGDDIEAEVAGRDGTPRAEYTKHLLAELIQSGGVAAARSCRPPPHRRPAT